MASIVDLAPPRPSATPSFRKIRAASRGFEVLFAFLFAAFIALAIFSLWILFFYQGTMIAIGPRGGIITTDPLPSDFVPFYTWRFDQRLVYAVDVIVRAIPTIYLFWCLRSLFRFYGQGEVFTDRTARLIQAMGVCLIADAALPFLCHLVLSATGYEIDKLWAHMAAVQELVLGAVVFVIALVMQAGREIEEDREGFI
ncbi:DUF2975 domain-containing protein [Phenylobacterium sp.]|jgi:hypothetical protein|uniref:DUF2975 domain-containing protein n=1 Tax=Phenylobacterium sp. TaxID=1871053 RepID=UPI002E317ED9|nr:DUF2975 domain-containing protein [Phenylobacterium sp.]HEX4711297.1 DUF2975 domain-containing protein [Phenylobacterium sp.]